MLGIEAIAHYIPEGRVSNFRLLEKFEIDENFLKSKIGVLNTAIKLDEETCSSMALNALNNLLKSTKLDVNKIDLLVVVTQNPDSNIPHVSGLVHGLAGLNNHCATFDISLGCSGYVFGISIVQSFMEMNGYKNGVLITCDPYSNIVNRNDKNTALLFGDAATATLISQSPRVIPTSFLFGSRGDVSGALTIVNNVLEMNGREVFNFAASVIPEHIKDLLKRNSIAIDDIDRFYLHQGSRFIVETIARRLGVDASKVPVELTNYGNTVSSSIPLMLENGLQQNVDEKIVLCGFGVGLSWASCICDIVR